jgi:hypothetical protein
MDIRVPIGLLFSLIGSLLLLYGLWSEISSGSITHLNLDTAWGAVLLIFGASMLWLARRHRRHPLHRE